MTRRSRLLSSRLPSLGRPPVYKWSEAIRCPQLTTLGGFKSVRFRRVKVRKRTIARRGHSIHKVVMDMFFEALFQWVTTKAGDRFGAWGVALAISLLLGATVAIFWWIFARP